MTWTMNGPQGFESRKIKYLLPKYTRGKVLELGCGMEKAFPHFVGYDSGHHFGEGAADVMGDAADLSQFKDESFDAVFSSHVLEHMDDMSAALDEWCRVIKPGGYLCLYVPSANLYPKCGEPGANPDHKHDIYETDITGMLDDSPFWLRQVEAEERNQDDEYSFFEIYKKLKTEDCTDADCVTLPLPRLLSQRKKTACVCRFGGFGDMLQAATVFPALKKQGFHVTVMTTPKGREVLEHDPHIDDWYIVDDDQVPNDELRDFWNIQAARFDRFVNLSESIEGQLLALPGRANFDWPAAVRKKRLNMNYHEWTAELAGVPFKPCQLFWPTAAEASEAAQQINPAEFNVLWALSGSSCHKFTPHQDAVIARLLMDMPEICIYLVGDDACKILEQGWEDEERVICLSGELSIRETLALAQQVDLVIGPETGVLNAVGMDARPHKILSLSHSSENNLSKHWQHCQSLVPADCACYPCHRLHYGTDFCLISDETGAARCAEEISPFVIFRACDKVYRNWQKGRLK